MIKCIYKLIIHSYQNSHSHLSTMINNALLDNVNSTSLDATILAAEGEEYQVICSYLYIEWIE
jgi:hypothetical protein